MAYRSNLSEEERFKRLHMVLSCMREGKSLRSVHGIPTSLPGFLVAEGVVRREGTTRSTKWFVVDTSEEKLTKVVKNWWQSFPNDRPKVEKKLSSGMPSSDQIRKEMHERFNKQLDELHLPKLPGNINKIVGMFPPHLSVTDKDVLVWVSLMLDSHLGKNNGIPVSILQSLQRLPETLKKMDESLQAIMVSELEKLQASVHEMQKQYEKREDILRSRIEDMAEQLEEKTAKLEELKRHLRGLKSLQDTL